MCDVCGARVVICREKGTGTELGVFGVEARGVGEFVFGVVSELGS
jgi:hypothetical protein